MTNNVRMLTRLALGLAFFLLVAGSRVALAQGTLTGTWTATVGDKFADKSDEKTDWSRDKKSDGLYLSLERRPERGGRSQMGQTYDFADLQGLSREQALAGGPVRFSLVREAGRVDFEGSFRDGKGSGTFTFTPDRGFVSAMKSRGFDFEKTSGRDDEREPENRLFAATMLNVTTALADDLLSADFGQLDVDDLFKATIFKVDSKFMREMKASGFPGLRMEELVKARIFHIDADFVREAARLGFDKEPFEHLVKMRIFKVTPEFVAEVRGEGLSDLSVEDLVKMRIFNIDADFIRSAKSDGTPLEVEALVQKRMGFGRHRSRP